MSSLMNWLVPRAHAVSFDSPLDFLTPAGGSTGTGTTVLTDIGSTIIEWILVIAGVLAIIYLIYSGILYITAAGNPDAAKKGQQGVINAIIGIVIIVLAYFIATGVANFAKGGVV